MAESENIAAMRAELSKEAEEARAKYEILEAVFDQMPDPVIVVNSTGKIFMVNNRLQKIFKYHRSKLIGQPVEMLMPESVREKHCGHTATYMRDPKDRPMAAGRVLRGKTSDGDEFPMTIELSSLVVTQGMFTIGRLRLEEAPVEAHSAGGG